MRLIVWQAPLQRFSEFSAGNKMRMMDTVIASDFLESLDAGDRDRMAAAGRAILRSSAWPAVRKIVLARGVRVRCEHALAMLEICKKRKYTSDEVADVIATLATPAPARHIISGARTAPPPRYSIAAAVERIARSGKRGTRILELIPGEITPEWSALIRTSLFAFEHDVAQEGLVSNDRLRALLLPKPAAACNAASATNTAKTAKATRAARATKGTGVRDCDEALKLAALWTFVPSNTSTPSPPVAAPYAVAPPRIIVGDQYDDDPIPGTEAVQVLKIT